MKSELLKAYARTSQSYSRQQTDGELEAWVTVLGNYGFSDVDAAIRRWQCNTTVEDWNGKPTGSRMPTAAELKLSIDGFERRIAKQAAGKFETCGKCDGGWVRSFHGKTVAGTEIDVRVGAVQRCQCWWDYLASRYGVTLVELPARLRDNQREKRGRAG